MDKEQQAIERLKIASEMSVSIYNQPLIVTYSGGKDSSVCVALAQRAGIPFEVTHNHTTADAPETVRFIRQEFYTLENKGIKCTINKPTYKGECTSMWTLIPEKLMPPTRRVRYCCEVLKEHGGDNRFLVTGVRWAESTKRKNSRGILEVVEKKESKRVIIQNDNAENRKLFEDCHMRSKRVCNPIIEWTDDDVWSFLRDQKIQVNPLYYQGFNRVGCVGCPLAKKENRNIELGRWPKYKKMYIKAFAKMLNRRIEKGKKNYDWRTGEDVFRWWMDDGVLSGQIKFEDIIGSETDA